MSIQEHLNKIRNAVYGREVRESIAKGIETAYDDASENGNANMEVKIARGTHPNLRSRLEEVDNKQQQTTAQLAQTDSELNAAIRNIGSASPSGAFTTFNELSTTYPNGDGKNWYVVTDNNFWYFWNGTSWESGGLFNATVSAEFPATNKVSNGDFSDGAVGWVGPSLTNTVVDNTLISSSRVDEISPNVRTNISTGNHKKDSKWFFKARVRVTNSDATVLEVYAHDGETYRLLTEYSPEINKWYEINTITTIGNNTSLDWYFKHNYLSAENGNGKEIEIQYVLAVDLTATFGSGHEPTTEDMNEYLSNYPLEWFGGTVSPFLNQKQLINYHNRLRNDVTKDINDVEKDIVEIKGQINKFNIEIKEPMPPTISPTLTPLGNVRLKHVTDEGVYWGTNVTRVVKSLDEGITWQDVFTVDIQQYGEIYATGLMVLETGRIIIGTMTGKVLISNESQTDYSQAFEFSGNGIYSNQLGNKVYENYIFIGGYNSTAISAPSNEVFMSSDYGESWRKIFTAPTIDTNNNHHIHDVEFDPYDKRIIVSTGDVRNRNLYYSDDMGDTWVTIFDEHDEHGNLQPTQIVAYSHGIIFGSDDAEFGGLHYLPRKEGLNQPIDKSEIVPDFYPIPNGPAQAPSFFAQKSAITRNPLNPVTLMPFTYMHPGGHSRILASSNGYHWYEIWKGQGTENVGSVYVSPDGLKGVGVFADNDGSRHVFKFTVPKFI